MGKKKTKANPNQITKVSKIGSKTEKSSHNSIINSKNSIYTYATVSIDGKRQHYKKCMYYDKLSGKCVNKNCSVTICQTAHNCTGFKRVAEKKSEKENKNGKYSDTYLDYPSQFGIHETTPVQGAILSQNIGTPCHTTFLKTNDKRRHKTHCIYYRKDGKFCVWFDNTCVGSSFCNNYTEIDDN